MRRALGTAARSRAALSGIGRPIAALGLALAAACSGGKRDDGPADSALTVPGDTTVRRDSSPTTTTDTATGSVVHADSLPPSPNSAAILLLAADSVIGDSLYHNSRGRCITCHGARGTGGGSLGPSLRDSLWVDTDGSAAGIAAIIRDGVAEPKGGTARMPAFARQLDDTQVNRIAVYVYSLSHRGAMASDSASAREAAGLPKQPADSGVHQ